MPTTTDSSRFKTTLRKEMRQKRRALTAAQREAANRGLQRQALKNLFYLRAKHIGLYIGNDGELDPSSFLGLLLTHGKQCFLPVLNPIQGNTMCFHQYQAGDELYDNRFGIPEPDPSQSRKIKADFLGLVLVPLVAFDRNGNRLGMGGGYYDRLFSAQNCKVRRPLLVGVAHHFQEVAKLDCDPWDVPLDAVMTDRSFIVSTTSRFRL